MSSGSDIERYRRYTRSGRFQSVAQVIPNNAWTELVFDVAGEDKSGLQDPGGARINKPAWAVRFRITGLVTFDDTSDKTGLRSVMYALGPDGQTGQGVSSVPLAIVAGTGSLVTQTQVLYVTPWIALANTVTWVALKAYQNIAGGNPLNTWPRTDLTYWVIEFDGGSNL